MTKILQSFILVLGGTLSTKGARTDAPPKTLSLPLSVSGVDSLAYTIPVSVGGQAFNLTLDTNAQALVFFEKGYQYIQNSCGNATENRNFFDPSSSKTYQDTGNFAVGWGVSRYPLFPYMEVACDELVGGAYELHGTVASDTLSLSSTSVDKVRFILAEKTYYPLNPAWASDGVFPLALRNAPDDSSSNALSSVLDGVGGNQEVTLWLSGTPTNTPTPGGQVTFGGKDTKNCGSKWTKLRSSVNFWTIISIGVSVGNTTVTGVEASISIASPFLAVPHKYFRPLVKALNGKYSDELHLYTVDCSKVGSLPDIRLKLGLGFSLQYAVTAEKYVAKMNTKQGTKCALLIVRTPDGFMDWTVGAQFLPKRCIHLDYDNGFISFADPAQSS
ncbi:renin [Aphelenchoides avenae]|nr:renin [Aphelenchus avenae]